MSIPAYSDRLSAYVYGRRLIALASLTPMIFVMVYGLVMH